MLKEISVIVVFTVYCKYYYLSLICFHFTVVNTTICLRMPHYRNDTSYILVLFNKSVLFGHHISHCSRSWRSLLWDPLLHSPHCWYYSTPFTHLLWVSPHYSPFITIFISYSGGECNVSKRPFPTNTPHRWLIKVSHV